MKPAAKTPPRSQPAGADQHLTTLLRLLLQAMPISAVRWVAFIGRILDCPELTQDLKEKAVLAANLASSQRPKPPEPQ